MKLIFINFQPVNMELSKTLSRQSSESESAGNAQGSSLSVEAIDAFSYSPSDSLPGRFAFRSFVFAGSINIYIA